jgi:hypothetical protein
MLEGVSDTAVADGRAPVPPSHVLLHLVIRDVLAILLQLVVRRGRAGVDLARVDHGGEQDEVADEHGLALTPHHDADRRGGALALLLPQRWAAKMTEFPTLLLCSSSDSFKMGSNMGLKTNYEWETGRHKTENGA